MKTIRNLLMFAVMLFAVGCDKEETFDVTPQTLAQTVWDAEILYYDENDSQTGTNCCIVEKSEQQIVLQGYYPNKVLIILDRVI